MALQRVGNVLAGRGAQSSHVGVADGSNGRVHLVLVSAGEGGIKGSTVVVGRADGVEEVDGVSLRVALAVTAVCGARLALEHVEGSVGHVAWVSLGEGRAARRAMLGVVVACAAAAAVIGGGVVGRVGALNSGAGGAMEAGRRRGRHGLAVAMVQRQADGRRWGSRRRGDALFSVRV